MKIKIRAIFSAILMMVFVLTNGAAAAICEPCEPYSNIYFSVAEASLSASSSLALLYEVSTREYMNQLGVQTITLYDLTTGDSTDYYGNMASGKVKSGRYTLSGAVKDHRYYAVVVFYADGLTTTCNTNTIVF